MRRRDPRFPPFFTFRFQRLIRILVFAAMFGGVILFIKYVIDKSKKPDKDGVKPKDEKDGLPGDGKPR